MDRCTICGSDFSELSFGGPGICPTCDCGIQPITIQKATIDDLRKKLESAESLNRERQAVIGRMTVYGVAWQHEETGNQGVTDTWQVEQGFFKNNPRLGEIGPVFTLPPDDLAAILNTKQEHKDDRN